MGTIDGIDWWTGTAPDGSEGLFPGELSSISHTLPASRGLMNVDFSLLLANYVEIQE